LLNLLDIHKNRSLAASEVATINYAIKARAPRFVAAANESWLYPERSIGRTKWADVDSVLNHKGFAWMLSAQETIIKYEDESILFTNPYGERKFVPGWFVKRNKKRN
jgi:hypothetical protein